MLSVFVLGDSISIGYGPHLAALLGDGFEYSRKRADDAHIPEQFNGDNGGDSHKVLGYVQARIAVDNFTPDVMVLNCGLHDIKRDPATGAYQVPLAEYEHNLRAAVELIQAHQIKLVWVRTTPVDDQRHNTLETGFQRFDADVRRYNARADAIMRAADVPIIDLYQVVQALRGNDVYMDHVHYTPRVEQIQGAFVAGAIRGLMLS